MARREIILGVDRTIMMALSMVVITALIDAPGLGEDVLARPPSTSRGAVHGGIAIVIMAILLDRLTSAERARGPQASIAGRGGPVRGAVVHDRLFGGVAIGVVGTVFSAARLPGGHRFAFGGPVNAASDWLGNDHA